MAATLKSNETAQGCAHEDKSVEDRHQSLVAIPLPLPTSQPWRLQDMSEDDSRIGYRSGISQTVTYSFTNPTSLIPHLRKRTNLSCLNSQDASKNLL